jgi:hypothetical protein
MLNNKELIKIYTIFGNSKTLRVNADNTGTHAWYSNNTGNALIPISGVPSNSFTPSYTPSSTMPIGIYTYVCIQTNDSDVFTTTFIYVIQPNQPYIQEIDVVNAVVKYGTEASVRIRIKSNNYYTLGYLYKYRLWQKINGGDVQIYPPDNGSLFPVTDTFFEYKTKPSTPAGDYIFYLEIIAVVDGIDSPSIISPDFTIIIEKQDIFVFPDAKIIFLGDPDPIFTYTTSILPNPLTGILTTTSIDRLVGSYLINTGLDSPNHNIFYQPAFLTILDKVTVDPNNNNFQITTQQITSIFGPDPTNSNIQKAEVAVLQDINTPATISVNVFNVNALTNSGQTSIPLVPDDPIPGISNVNVDTSSVVGASYIIVSIIPVDTTNINIPTSQSSPVLFSLYFKALDANGNSVVSRFNPFVIDITLENTEEIKLIKFVNGSYVTLVLNVDYE